MGAASALPAVASAGLSIAGALGQGAASKTQGQIDAIRDQTAAKAAETRAVQTHAAYDQKLARGLGALTSIEAVRNVGVDSATSMAVADRAETLSDYAAAIDAGNQRLQQITAQTDGGLALAAGKSAMIASYLKAAPDAAKGIQGIYQYGQDNKIF